MAYDTCSIPAMSAECERVFSISTKLLITDRRNRLKEDIIEASEVLKSWLYQGKCMFYNCFFIAIIFVLTSLLSRNSHTLPHQYYRSGGPPTPPPPRHFGGGRGLFGTLITAATPRTTT